MNKTGYERILPSSSVGPNHLAVRRYIIGVRKNSTFRFFLAVIHTTCMCGSPDSISLNAGYSKRPYTDTSA